MQSLCAVRLPARAFRLFAEQHQKHMGHFCYRSVQFYFKDATVIFLFFFRIVNEESV